MPIINVEDTDNFLGARRDLAIMLREQGWSPPNAWFFGVIASELTDDHELIDPEGVEKGWSLNFRRLQQTPDLVELAATGTDPTLLPHVAIWTPHLTHELVVRFPDQLVKHDAFLTAASFARSVSTLLKIASRSQMIIPVASNISWSVVATSSSDELNLRLVEHYPRFLSDEDHFVPMGREHFDWASSNLYPLLLMTQKHESFMLAVEAFADHLFQSDLKMAIASLWTGIEALTNPGAGGEVTFRLALNGAAFLEPIGKDRSKIFRKISDLYTVRSKILHGASVDDETVATHVIEARNLLARLLEETIAVETVPSNNAYLKMLLERG